MENRKTRRVLGCGICMAGALILAVGIILGVQFPKYVTHRVHEHVCISGRHSKHFPEWEADYDRKKVNRIFYWAPRNLTDLFSKTPELSMKGPYAYEEKEHRKGVVFHNGYLHYWKSSIQNLASEVMNRECKECQEDEEVIAVNPNYLQLVNRYGSREIACMALVPLLIRYHKELSSFKGNCSVPKPRTFESWLDSEEESYKDIILTDYEHEDFDEYEHEKLPLDELLSLSVVLTSERSLGAGVFIRNDVQSGCEDMYNLAVTEDVFPANPPRCGVAWTLNRFLNGEQTSNETRIAGWMLEKYFNPKPRGNETWYVNQRKPRVQRAYLYAIANFLNRELVPAACTLLNVPPVDKFSQKVLSFGQDYLDRHFQGALPYERTENYAPIFTLKTCVLDRSLRSNLYWKSVHLSGEETARSVHGYSIKIPPVSSLSTCRSAYASETNITVFLPEMGASIDFQTGTTMKLSGVSLQVFQPSESSASKVYQNPLTGLYTTLGFPKQKCVEYNATNISETKILVEPISGEFWVISSVFTSYAMLNYTDMLLSLDICCSSDIKCKQEPERTNALESNQNQDPCKILNSDICNSEHSSTVVTDKTIDSTTVLDNYSMNNSFSSHTMTAVSYMCCAQKSNWLQLCPFKSDIIKKVKEERDTPVVMLPLYTIVREEEANWKQNVIYRKEKKILKIACTGTIVFSVVGVVVILIGYYIAYINLANINQIVPSSYEPDNDKD